jgi:hypothetical protein
MSVSDVTMQTRAAHVVQVNRYGPPEVLTYAEVLMVPLSAHEVRIKTLIAPVNHTDLREDGLVLPRVDVKPPQR